MVSFEQLIPATDWYYVMPSKNTGMEFIVWQVAAFALCNDEKGSRVVGLISASFNNDDDRYLKTVPQNGPGQYLKREQLTKRQLELSRTP